MAERLSIHFYEDEKTCVERLLNDLDWDAERAARVHARAAALVEAVRDTKRKRGELESFLQQYGLNTEEGLALMTLAEALLRIPDTATADALIRDKMSAAVWLGSRGGSDDLLVKAAGFGLSLTRKALDSAVARLGEPLIRRAMVEALRMLGRQFVLGRTIEEGVKNGRAYAGKGYRLSYDMLGEGARTADDAQRYAALYGAALAHIGKTAVEGPRPGLSVKLSALYPRYEYGQKDRCVPEMTERLRALARQAADLNVSLTVDAEECERLDLSLAMIRAVAEDNALNGWEGFGLAVQAYQKRGFAVIGFLEELAENTGRRLQVRLVKGAYWDTEIKRAQVLSLPDYPVFTRKVNTDVSYLACARRLLARRDIFYPMLGTHNAHTVAAVLELAGNDRTGFEFQRLHGMGETLHGAVLEEGLAAACVYAPCGAHEDLLPYLVRRLLENGASSSFVHQILDARVPVEKIVSDPVAAARAHDVKRHPKIPLPAALYGAARCNSAGLDLTEDTIVQPLLRSMAESLSGPLPEAAPLVGGRAHPGGPPEDICNPADTAQIVGRMIPAQIQTVEAAFKTAQGGFAHWSRTPAADRAAVLESLADKIEGDRTALMALCVREAGKTVPDALAEIREAADFCRYYAAQGRALFAEDGRVLCGPTGERNVLTLHGRGPFVCISPWNFPLAIFTGQIAAALMAGNAVIAKPAEQTPLIAARLVRLAFEAGLPPAALALLPGGGDVGAALTVHPDVAGVAFTGSTETARAINRALAAKDGPIVPLVAETGGQNAMIVDSSALPEQVIDDVLASAFGAAGQRCSALRVLFVQDDVADRIIAMLRGAMAQRRVGDPALLSTDIGPVIDAAAQDMLRAHREKLERIGTFIAAVPVDAAAAEKGRFFAPVAYEIDALERLDREVFGPVLHVVRFRAVALDGVVQAVNATGYGLTFGLHTRIGAMMETLPGRIAAGNAYINRTMIGAVVGVQPFGGQGLSGTGPKAGGPHYLPRFATERIVSTDTTRQGGNASLVTLEEEA